MITRKPNSLRAPYFQSLPIWLVRVLGLFLFVFVLLVVGRGVASGWLLSLPSGVDIFFNWANVYTNSPQSVSWWWITIMALAWLDVFGIAFLVTRQVGILVVGGLLLTTVAPADLSGLQLHSNLGFSVRFTGVYWISAFAMMWVFAPSLPEWLASRKLAGSRPVIAFGVVGIVALVYGSLRGDVTSFVNLAFVFELISAFYLTARWVSTPRGLVMFINLVIAIALFKSGHSYYLFLSDNGAPGPSLFGRLGVHGPAFGALMLPLILVHGFVSRTITSDVPWMGKWPIAMAIAGLVMFASLFGAQRAIWIAVVMGISGTILLAVYFGVFASNIAKISGGIILILVIGVTALLVTRTNVIFIGANILERAQFTSQEFDTANNFVRRQEYSKTITEIRGNPFLGGGLGYTFNFTEVNDPSKFRGGQAHMSVTWIASRMGLLGLAAFALVFVSLMKDLFTSIRGIDGYPRLILIGFAATLLTLGVLVFIDNWFPQVWRTAITGSLLGAAAGSARLYRNEQDGQGRSRSKVGR